MINRIKDYLLLLFNYLRYKIANISGRYPKGIEVQGGKLILDIRSKIILDSTSALIVQGTINLRNSTIRLEKSTVDFSDLEINNSYLDCKETQICIGKNGLISEAVLRSTQSKIAIADNAKVFRTKMQIDNSQVKADQYLLIDGKYNQIPNLLILSSNATIGKNVNIKCKLECRNATLILGDNIFLNHGTEVRCHNFIKIGNNVLISYECLIFDTNTHSLSAEDRIMEISQGYPNNTRQSDLTMSKTAPIEIGDNVWIGMRVAVLKGSKVRNNSVIGLMTVMSGEFPEYSLIAGNPGKLIRIIS